MKAAGVVVVGASLGGMEAISTLLAGLTPAFAPPVVIVQHRPPGPESRLIDIFARATSIPVVEPDDHERLEPGRAYLAPPDYHTLLEPGRLVLSVDEPVERARPSIDVLFESAARAYGASTFAVLLTGANEDGARGIEAVHAVGGVTIVQNPDEAEAPTAPRAALARVAPTYVLSVAEMAAVLVAWSQKRVGR